MGRRVIRSEIDLRRALKGVLEKDLPRHVAQIHAKVHIEAVNGLVRDTPVGNPDLWKSPPPPGYVGGRARGGWQSTIGTPATSETGQIDPGGASAEAAGVAIASRIEPGSVSYVSNPVPYIQRLNDGWSTQQPAGFVERTQDRLRRMFQ